MHGSRGRADRVVILGLDAVSWDIVERLAAAMPRLSALRANAPSGILGSTQPPLTPVAWTSMTTGMSPGHHGVYEFFHRGATGWVPVSRQQCRVAGLDEILEHAGRQSILVNLPLSSPGRSRAIRLADFLTRADETVFPPELRQETPALAAYRAFWDPAPFAARSVEEAAGEVREMEAQRFAAARHLLETKPWDYVFYGITGTDHLQHRALDLILGEGEPPAVVVEFYRQVDEIVGWFIDNTRPGDLLLVTSDHGSAVTGREFFLNEWLVRQGYARWRAGAATGAGGGGLRGAVRALAFRLQLDVRTAGLRRRLGQRRRLAGGPVAEIDDVASDAFMPPPFAWPAVYAPRADRAVLAEQLRELVDPGTGRHLFAAVEAADRVYPPDRLPGGPDLVLTPAPGISVHPGRSAELVRAHRRNHHKAEGIVVAYDPGRRFDLPADLGSPRVEDIAPTVLVALGLPGPASAMDGRSLVADPSVNALRAVRAAARAAAGAAVGAGGGA